MHNITNYFILKERKLIIEYYSGKIYLNDFLKIHEKKSKDKDFNVNFNLLIDFRNAEILLSETDVLALVNFHKNNKKLFGKRKSAHLTQTPDQVLSGMHFDIFNKELPIIIKIFSTLEASLRWLGLEIEDIEIIKSNLDKLKLGE